MKCITHWASASCATRVEFKEKKSGGVRAWMHKTGYISRVFTAWGKPTISPAPSETGGSVDMKKKFALDHPFAWRQLDRPTARYIYKAKNGKLHIGGTDTITHKKQSLNFNNIYKLYFTKIFFKPSCTDVLKILEKELFCSVIGHFKVLWLFGTKTFMSKAVNNS
jgi:hypothetical protein